MSQRWPGGLIKPTPITPTGPYQDGSASGVWTLDQMEYWLQQGLWPIAGNAAPVGLFSGGAVGAGYSNVIDYILIATAGNATDFGDLTQARSALGSCASTTRACAAGGEQTGGSKVGTIDYVTIATKGNATNFGSLTTNNNYGVAGCNSSTRGLFGGGLTTWPSNVIEYITIASTGNATDFGDLTRTTYTSGACSSPTRGLFGGGFSASSVNVVDYVTIASTGNATDFGDLTVARYGLEGASNTTRALFAGGADTNVIDYVTIASTGNATDFGDLTFTTSFGGGSGASSIARAVFMGGTTNTTCYVTISSTGNAVSFGQLSVTRQDLTACSSNNGGVQ